MDRAAAELFLASLFVETTPERLEALRNAAQAAKSWEGLIPALEGHGVLLLFQRNLGAAGIEVPTALAASLENRAGVQRDDHLRARLSLQRFLAGAARLGAEVTLVGGSALCLDLYASPLRRLGELEVFVPPEHFARALRAGEDAGLLPTAEALPAWWYRRTGSALRLAPSSVLLRGVRVSPLLHHPSLLLTTREPEVLARRRRAPFEGFALQQLEPMDALLELAVHVAAAAGEALVLGRRQLLLAASTPEHALRLDQLLDLRTFVERHHAELAVPALLARAQEWSAEPALRATLECLQMGLGFLPAARAWARQVVQALAGSAAAGTNGAQAALFRPDPIERLPLWVRPSEAYLARRYALAANAGPQARKLARARHLASLLGAGLLAGVGYPAALVGRQLARSSNRAAWAAAGEPQRMSDVSEAFRSAARVEQQKPITPKSIALLPQEEGAVRLPDHYKG
ncbi:MAG: hypothetical protein EXS08_08695 [Planctomycetes bacterium]|nr:hypothetical protein [Planctomycetota bacterium]